MRIDLATDTYEPDINGVAMTLGRLVKGLRARGHLVHVLRASEREGLFVPGETVMPSLPLPMYREVKIGLPSADKFRARWIKKRPDVVYVATESPMGASAAKAARALGIPVVMGFHTNVHQYVKNYRFPGLETTAVNYLRKMHHGARLTLVPTEEVLRSLDELGFERLAVMGRGVDTSLFDPGKRDVSLRQSWGVWRNEVVFGVVGRLAREKNLVTVLNLYSRLQREFPDRGMKMVVVGDGPLMNSLRSEFPDAVFCGTRSGEDLARHYASLDVLLFASETETFGNVLLEGMASGLATVSYRYAASADLVLNGVNGLQAEKGEEEGFYAAMSRLLQNAELVRRLGEQARLAVHARTWDAVYDRFEELLSSVAREENGFGCARPPRGAVLECRTVFLSDLHLGTRDCKADECRSLLKHIRAEKIVLVGDIVDAWALSRGSRWRKRHTRFVRTLLKKIEQEDVEVLYLRGNHDDVLERFLPFALGRLHIAKEHVHRAADGRRYLCVHGDGFDAISTHHRWLAVLGSLGYDVLLMVNRLYNRYRTWRGREYYSVSRAIKGKVKSAVNFIGHYEQQLQNLALKRQCDGIIAGHVHHPADSMIGKVRYLNCGDWVETMSAVVEYADGRMEMLLYKDFMKRLACTPGGRGREWEGAVHRAQE